MDGLSFLAFHRVAKFIKLQREGMIELFCINPVELDAAPMRDIGLTVIAPRSGNRPEGCRGALAPPSAKNDERS